MKMIIICIIGDLFKLNFLNIENKFSKQGYHKRCAIKYGEIKVYFISFNKKYPNNKLKIYAPPSPINNLLLIFKDK